VGDLAGWFGETSAVEATGVPRPPNGAVEIRVLGPLQVVGPDGELEVRRGLPAVLLTALVVRAGEVVPADVLIEELYRDRPLRNAANALQVQVSYLRRQLRPAGDRVAIERHGEGYRLVLDGVGVDAWRFDQVVGDLRRARPEVATRPAAEGWLAVLEEVLASWRGDAFQDAADVAHAQPERARLDELRVVAGEQRAELLTALGRHAESAAVLQALVAEHPLRESLWGALILALHRAGRQAEALRAYGEARRRLVEELGIEPGRDLRALERAVLDQDPELAWTPCLADDDPGAGAPPPPVAAPVAPAAADPAVAPRRRGIPASVSPLIGRAWEVGAVTALLDDHRLVTLVGPGGVGKTRIAFEAAGARPAPTVVVDLAAVSDAATVPSVLAAAVPVATTPDDDPLVAVADRIGDDPWLIVLDTCEHVLDRAATAAEGLLHRCPRLRILATSRQALDVVGEHTWPVPTLELPTPDAATANEVGATAAARLFVDRAQATHPHFVLDDGNAPAVAAICRALDGLPLAIELAAARVGLLTPASILDRLEDRFGLLTRSRPDAGSRQRSLLETVRWSHELLTPEEQRFFAALGVFAGSFDLAAAEALAAIEGDGAGDGLGLLASLVDRSLVVAGGDDRYRLLDTLRELARQELAADPERRDRAARAHAAWYLGVALRADPVSHGPLPGSWADLRADAADLRGALAWAFGPSGDPALGARLVGALAGSMALDGAFAEADRWITRAETAATDDVTGATVLRGKAVVALYRGRYEVAVSAAEASVAHARATGQGRLEASTAVALGSALWGVGALTRSAEVLDGAATLFDAEGDVRGRGFALARRARSLTALGHPDAVACATAGVDDLETTRDDWMTVAALDHLAEALLRSGDARSAAARADQAIALAAEVGSTSGWVGAQAMRARVHLAMGDHDDAVAALRAAAGRALEVRNMGAVADGLEGLARVAEEAGDVPGAVALLAAAGAVRAGSEGVAPAHLATEREALAARLRAALSDEEHDAARRRGARLSPADALAVG
jgi:predicted ATPase/DNA-binding SARP family transcriptional activator